MPFSLSPRPLCALLTLLFAWTSAQASDPWGAPAGYYASATGTGATLKSQLHNIIDDHIEFSYGDARFILQVTDEDPNDPDGMLLVYSRVSIDLPSVNPFTGWDQGQTWNREHTWPRSRGVNSSGDDNSDLHQLRPANPSVNGSRGNLNFGGAFGSNSGNFGAVSDGGTVWYPGDEDAGLIARQQFYMAVRYDGSDSSTIDLELQPGNPGGSTLGNLNRLIEWHYEVAPDGFERRRNDVIYDDYQGNRNPFTDHPEFVWSVFVDQQNDTRLALSGGTSGSNGASTLDLDLGRVYVNGAAPASTNVSLAKNGADGTYYSVSTSGDATTDAGHLARAVAMGGGWSDSFSVGLDVGSTAVAGVTTGSVTVDNLDVTTGGGAGRGANDGNDVVNLSFSVLDHPVASFADSTLSSAKVIDFGSVPINSGVLMESFDIFNYAGAGAPSFAADLDVDGVSDPGVAAFSTGVGTVAGIAQGASQTFQATLDTSTAGQLSAVYTLNLSGEDLPGEQQQTLTLTLLANVVGSPVTGDYNGDGIVDAADYTVYRDDFGSTTSLAADGDGDGEIDADDYAVWSGAYGTGFANSAAVPEPSTAMIVAVGFAAALTRRRARQS